MSNSDPITGQAAWYDLRVNIQKAEAGEGVTEPVTGTKGPQALTLPGRGTLWTGVVILKCCQWNRQKNWGWSSILISVSAVMPVL